MLVELFELSVNSDKTQSRQGVMVEKIAILAGGLGFNSQILPGFRTDE